MKKSLKHKSTITTPIVAENNQPTDKAQSGHDHPVTEAMPFAEPEAKAELPEVVPDPELEKK